MLEPRPLFDPFELQTTATRSPEGFTLNGMKALVPRVADAELFVVAAQIEGEGPGLFIVESATAGLLTEPEPGMGIRAASTGRLILEDVTVGAGALLGGAEARGLRRVHPPRPAGLGVDVAGHLPRGAGLRDPLRERAQAFGEPISNRQAVAFMVSDIAIELDGMKLTTYRAASRADQEKPFAKEAGIARQLAVEKGMQIGSERRAAAGRPRLRQGIPGRALVSRPARRGRDGRSSARLPLD